MQPRSKERLSFKTKLRMKFGKKRKYRSNLVTGICYKVFGTYTFFTTLFYFYQISEHFIMFFKIKEL
jgi:hypothetical protein